MQNYTQKDFMTSRPERMFDADFKSALRYLQSDEISLSPSLLFALSDLNRQEMQEFAKTWQTFPAAKRSRVTLAMAELAEERIEADFTRIFRYLLDDEDAAVRANAINGLWEDEDPVLAALLIGALRSDPAVNVRAAAAEGLGRFVLRAETKRLPAALGDEIQTALLAVIRSRDEQIVRRRAIESLAYVGNETVRDIIASAYAHDDAKMRATAVFAMGRSADPYWKRTVAQELYSPDPQLRFEAARAVGELEFRAEAPRLIELVDDADREVQSAAITSLGQIGGKEARRALIAILEGDDEVAREIAQDALDELEFASGSNMLLVDIGLESGEEAILAEELQEEEELFDADEDDEPRDLLDDGALRPRRKR
ncbi:MAG: HEAT repeat domain-containing protein [Chloroflexi bacterium]|nr:HEAT repeat domain-containing protein [Chloroflexota bacterium]